MAFTTLKPDFDITMPDLSYSGIELLNDITAAKIWADGTIQYGFGTGGVLGLDKEFARMFHSMFGNAKPDKQFAFASTAERAFRMIDTVAAIDLERTTDVGAVDLVLTSTDDKPKGGLEGFFQFPGKIGKDGTFNMLLGDGEQLFARCSTQLHHLIRRAPFCKATLRDEDVCVDFAQFTTPRDRVAVVATAPLTRDESWTAAEPDTLWVFRRGRLTHTLAS